MFNYWLSLVFIGMLLAWLSWFYKVFSKAFNVSLLFSAGGSLLIETILVPQFQCVLTACVCIENIEGNQRASEGLPGSPAHGSEYISAEANQNKT